MCAWQVFLDPLRVWGDSFPVFKTGSVVSKDGVKEDRGPYFLTESAVIRRVVVRGIQSTFFLRQLFGRKVRKAVAYVEDEGLIRFAGQPAIRNRSLFRGRVRRRVENVYSDEAVPPVDRQCIANETQCATPSYIQRWRNIISCYIFSSTFSALQVHKVGGKTL